VSHFITIDGTDFHLGRIPCDPDKTLCKKFAEAVPQVPRSDWWEVNRRAVFDKSWILNQRSHGSCVGFSAAGATQRARGMTGAAFERLSGAFVYSFINGGRDQGATVTDAVKVLADKGTCLDSEAPWDAIYPNRYPASAKETAKRFRVSEFYYAETFDEMASAILLDYIPVFAVMVGSSFTRLNSDGVAGYDRGPGNHAVHADGLVKTPGGIWVLDMPNSWGIEFGEDGRCKLTQRHIEGVQQDCYVIKCAAEDSKDANNPPVIAA
jgi:hypothetical protein